MGEEENAVPLAADGGTSVSSGDEMSGIRQSDVAKSMTR